MKLQGEVLKRFQDKETKITYDTKGSMDIEEYTGKETTYPYIYIGEKERYEELYEKGYLTKGKLYEEYKSKRKYED